MTTRLISVDSHVKIAPDAIKEGMPSKYHAAWDDAVATERAQHLQELGGIDSSVLVAGFSHEAFSNPGYHDPAERLKAMADPIRLRTLELQHAHQGRANARPARL